MRKNCSKTSTPSHFMSCCKVRSVWWVNWLMGSCWCFTIRLETPMPPSCQGRRSSTPRCCHVWSSDPPPAPGRTAGCRWGGGGWSRAPGTHLRQWRDRGERLYCRENSCFGYLNVWNPCRTNAHCKTAGSSIVKFSVRFYFWSLFIIHPSLTHTHTVSSSLSSSSSSSSPLCQIYRPSFFCRRENRRHSEVTSHVQSVLLTSGHEGAPWRPNHPQPERTGS